MGDFQRRDSRGGGFRGGNGGGRPSFGGGRGGDRGPVTMHKAVCDECHNNCEVPFRPSGDKPIYCNDCFGGKRGNDAPRKDFGGDRGPRKEFNDRPSPSFSKPVQAPVNDELKKQLNDMNMKLDRLINALEKNTQPKAEIKVAVAPVKKVEAKKVTSVAKKVVAKAPVKKVVAKKKK